MTEYILSGPASRDVDEILAYISEQSSQTAWLVAKRFENAFEQIASMPGIGHVRGELKDDRLRVSGVSGFLVIYDPSFSPVHILRVVRGSRNLRRITTDYKERRKK